MIATNLSEARSIYFLSDGCSVYVQLMKPFRNYCCNFAILSRMLVERTLRPSALSAPEADKIGAGTMDDRAYKEKAKRGGTAALKVVPRATA